MFFFLLSSENVKFSSSSLHDDDGTQQVNHDDNNNNDYCDIRCYCNQPVCVRTGYMCKSKGNHQQAGCYVEHTNSFNNMMNDRSSDISRHGCIEMLSNDQRIPCMELALALRSSLSHHHNHNHNHHSNHHRHHSSIHIHQPMTTTTNNNNNHNNHPIHRKHNKTITCCLDDMCNYVKTINDDTNNDSDNHHHHQQPQSTIISSSNEFDSFGKHLQENFGIEGSSIQQSYGSILIIVIIMTPVLILISIICMVILFIRKDDKNKKFPKQLSINNNNNNKDHHHHQQQQKIHQTNHHQKNNKFSIKSKINANNNKQKLFVDVNKYPHGIGNIQSLTPFTQLDEDIFDNYPESLPSLPNIISGHNLPSSTAITNDFTIIEFDKRKKETTFSTLTDQNRVENTNTIYMSPPQPPLNNSHLKSINHSNHLDLVSETFSEYSNRAFKFHEEDR
ncbi:hypothetical protein DERP_007315 [Dermatophagoides pteronyssinus]|uniref:BMP and activin membrane-bound inhibitor N-terminal domain-containing protein n=1 Tax=Dermatophagoides pteronyssinus TaxID=6956 RepID=A0ABQ8J479_DERPT|nr:hypothetical protein DERP_007315 [Dermatophagoides pteronyssinus]